jgi:hypothetical protein
MHSCLVFSYNLQKICYTYSEANLTSLLHNFLVAATAVLNFLLDCISIYLKKIQPKVISSYFSHVW